VSNHVKIWFSIILYWGWAWV